MDKCDIIILAGQSNAEGQGRGPVTREYVPDERILMLTDGGNAKFVKENGKERLEICYPTPVSVSVAEERRVGEHMVGCFALQFAQAYAQKYLKAGRKVLIVNASVSGTGFHRPEWGVENVLHQRMVSMTKQALSYNPENRVVALLWSQGEHDSFEDADWDAEKRYRIHKANLSTTFQDLYSQLGGQKFPIIACGFTDGFYESNTAACDAVLQAIRECVADVGGGFVETAGLLANKHVVGGGDFIHFSRESLHMLGGRFFEKYEQLIR